MSEINLTAHHQKYVHLIDTKVHALTIRGFAPDGRAGQVMMDCLCDCGA